MTDLKHLSGALKICRINLDEKELQLTIKLYELFKESGEDTTFKDVSRIQAEVEQLKK